MDLTREVLEFWFGSPDEPGYPRTREVWFKSTPAFDAEIRNRFAEAHERAKAGEFDGMAADAEGAVALLVLLEQFPRNMHRGTAAAFAGDAKAREIAAKAVDAGFDGQVPPAMRTFLYLPFEHSEDAADQQRSVALFEAMGDAEKLDYAVRHKEVIDRFGRFPHRNAALGRANTADEEVYLAEPGAGF